MMVLAAIVVWICAGLMSYEVYKSHKFLEEYYKRNPQMRRGK